MRPVPAEPLVHLVVRFAAALRESGVDAGPEQSASALAGLERVELARTDDVYWTLRQTFVSNRDDLAVFDDLFRTWFPGTGRDVATAPAPLAQPAGRGAAEAVAGGDQTVADTTPGWTATESLRTKDFADVTADELRALGVLVPAIASLRPHRRSRRYEQRPRVARLDIRRTVRAAIASGGDPADRSFRARLQVPRRVVFLCDVSGSMAPYTRALLMFAHGLARAGRGVEIFAFGTRLTRLTAQLAARDTDRALAAAAGAVADWSGGTRIGASLKRFNVHWGNSATARGAVVIIASDGWERDDTSAVGREMARLGRQAYAVVWVNPLKGHPDYQPLAGGMRAALPYVDRFLPGHNVASLETLAAVLAGIGRRHSPSVGLRGIGPVSSTGAASPATLV